MREKRIGRGEGEAGGEIVRGDEGLWRRGNEKKGRGEESLRKEKK